MRQGEVSVFRREHFNSAHRLFNPDWDDATNQKIFGKCANPHFHGHNYEIELKVTGTIDPSTGYVMDMKVLSDLINELVIQKFDHRNLNLDVPEFKELNPTAENIAIVIFNLLRPHIDPKLSLLVRLYETERNFVEYAG